MGSILSVRDNKGILVEGEKKEHINILEMKAAIMALKAFTKNLTNRSILLRTDNMTTLAYLMKMGGTKNRTLSILAQEIWSYLIPRNLSLSVEHIRGELNKVADRESRANPDSSEWKLDTKVFRKISAIWGKPHIDLFASRTCHQLTPYFAWKPDPLSKATDAMQQEWSFPLTNAFPPFCLIGRVIKKARSLQTPTILVCPLWQTQGWYPMLLQSLIAEPVILS